ncbi:hypothetical protein [Agrococcus sp. ARC_14]|uniref:hypothetical protein n=1 Tax=Agrococcus sp. ARC_14 TaxID=2919927 RepID=UPI001F05DD51|nr:hypothetical protein [Agrococcus sp. ARC_14]MCH1883961.1 hypothetical protein [Agrococcus sp. ARC_14]
MSDDDLALAIIESDDGIMLLGDELALQSFEAKTGVNAKKLTQQSLALAGKALGVMGAVQANSGRWVKLTKESAEFVKKHGEALSKADNLMTGVVRGEGGKILKHLKFEHAALLTPAAPMALATMMTQASLEASLDDIQEYLEVIDAKLDRLLKQRKIEALGQIGGVTFAIDEAKSIYDATGRVSAITWSKVQANSLALQTMQAEAVAQLGALAELVKERGTDTDKSAAVLEEVREDVSFWLGVLARTMALQDRQYVLELARVIDSEPDQLDQHRHGIRAARLARTNRIARTLDAINASVHDAATLTNRDRVANPFSSRRVTDRANGVNNEVAEFARHADLAVTQVEQADNTPWARAARALVGEAADQVGAIGDGVATRAKAVGAGIQEQGDSVVLSLAKRVQARRDARRAEDAPAAIENPEPRD